MIVKTILKKYIPSIKKPMRDGWLNWEISDSSRITCEQNTASIFLKLCRTLQISQFFYQPIKVTDCRVTKRKRCSNLMRNVWIKTSAVIIIYCKVSSSSRMRIIRHTAFLILYLYLSYLKHRWIRQEEQLVLQILIHRLRISRDAIYIKVFRWKKIKIEEIIRPIRR